MYIKIQMATLTQRTILCNNFLHAQFYIHTNIIIILYYVNWIHNYAKRLQLKVKLLTARHRGHPGLLTTMITAPLSFQSSFALTVLPVPSSLFNTACSSCWSTNGDRFGTTRDVFEMTTAAPTAAAAVARQIFPQVHQTIVQSEWLCMRPRPPCAHVFCGRNFC